jgi:hypothetical protein
MWANCWTEQFAALNYECFEYNNSHWLTCVPALKLPCTDFSQSRNANVMYIWKLMGHAMYLTCFVREHYTSADLLRKLFLNICSVGWVDLYCAESINYFSADFYAKEALR